MINNLTKFNEIVTITYSQDKLERKHIQTLERLKLWRLCLAKTQDDLTKTRTSIFLQENWKKFNLFVPQNQMTMFPCSPKPLGDPRNLTFKVYNTQVMPVYHWIAAKSGWGILFAVIIMFYFINKNMNIVFNTSFNLINKLVKMLNKNITYPNFTNKKTHQKSKQQTAEIIVRRCNNYTWVFFTYYNSLQHWQIPLEYHWQQQYHWYTNGILNTGGL